MARQLTNKERNKLSIRRKISGTAERPRLSVFRSNKAVYAQLINDLTGTTLASSSTQSLGLTGVKIENSKAVGTSLAEKAKAAGIASVVFDRNGLPYHGNVKAVAEGAREGGLVF